MSANDDLNQRVTDRIQAELLAIFPADELRSRVDKAIEQFFNRTYSQHGGGYTASKFEQLVTEAMTAHTKEVLKELLSSNEWKAQVNKDLTIHVGTALQAAMKVDLNVIKDTASKLVAEQQALTLAGILSQTIAVKLNDYGVHDAVMNAVRSNFNTIKR